MRHQHPFPRLSSVPGLQGSTGVMVNGVVEVSQDVTITEPLWVFGTIKPLAGVTVTINGPMVAGAGQIFDLSAGGTIAGTPEVERVLPNWWGADPNGIADSAPAINAAVVFCTGDYKPRVEFLAGVYKCMAQIIKPHSFHCPIILGLGGGSNSVEDAAGTVLDFSAATLAGDQTCIMLKGGSGRTTHGGLRNLQIIGNGQSIGVQFNDQCGAFAENLTLLGQRIGVEFFNEQGFSEWNKLIGCQVHTARDYAYAFRRTGGTDSFHGVEIIDCWANLAASSKAAVRVGSGCKWYNGTGRLRVFFAQGLSAYQDVFSIDPGASDVDIDGYIKTESGNGWGRVASGRAVNFPGSVLALTGITWGTLNPVRYSIGIGPEGGAANGVTATWRMPQSYGPRYITVDAAGDWYTGMGFNGAYDCEIIVSAPNYEYRVSGIGKEQGYGGNGAFFETAVWAMNNQRGFGKPNFRVDNGGNLFLNNKAYPPGEVKFYMWHQQRSLSVQGYQKFATMNP